MRFFLEPKQSGSKRIERTFALLSAPAGRITKKNRAARSAVLDSCR
jgi:hypothetical protein